MSDLIGSTEEIAQKITQAASDALHAANQVEASDLASPLRERQVRQPDTWLLRHCYRKLAENGSPEATFDAVKLIQHREATALYEVLPVLARRASRAGQDAFLRAVEAQLHALRYRLADETPHELETWCEQLLCMACAAANIGDSPTAFAALERLDQAEGAWVPVLAREPLRMLLAETVALVGLHPLTRQLLQQGLRQHAEPGAHFLREVAVQAAGQLRKEQDRTAVSGYLPPGATGSGVRRSRRLLERCVEIFRYATLTSLLSRRYAAVTFALVNDVDAILEQITIIANVQEARRESGLGFERSSSFRTSRTSNHSRDTGHDASSTVVRQVKRPRANPDVDFRLYTLKEATEQLDPEQVSAEKRHELAEWIGYLGSSSDGWTAAAATDALLQLGEVQQAIDVVDRIDAQDATRSEAFCVLVQGLLAAAPRGLPVKEAEVQTQKAIQWAQALPELHPERLTVWGVAKAYLSHNRAQDALAVLDKRRTPGLYDRLRRLFRTVFNEEDLREEALRLHASLLGEDETSNDALQYLQRIREIAPQLLEGKALALFYTENVLEPVIQTGHHRLAWQFLRDVREALGGILSREQPARVEAAVQILVEQIRRLRKETASMDKDHDAEAEDSPGVEAETERVETVEKQTDADSTTLEAGYAAATELLLDLWQRSAQYGIWPTVYSIGGSLPLVIELCGSTTVTEIARVTVDYSRTQRNLRLSDAEETDLNDSVAGEIGSNAEYDRLQLTGH